MVSAQQYLCSDYMQALSSTSTSSAVLDSNKSPLAMLARTCDSIGMPSTDLASMHHKAPKHHGGHGGSSYVNGSSGGGAKRSLSSNASAVGPSHQTADQKNEPVNKRLKPSSNAGSTTSTVVSKNVAAAASKQQEKCASQSPVVNDLKADTSGSGKMAVDEPRHPSHRNSSPSTSKLVHNPVTSSSSSASASTSVSPAVPALPTHGFYAPGMVPITPSSTILAASMSSFPYSMVGSTSSAAGILPLACYPSTLAVPAGLPRLCLDPLCKSCPVGSTTAGTGAPGAFLPGTSPLPGQHHIRGMCPVGCAQCNVDPWLASYYMMGLHQLALANSGASVVPAPSALAPNFHGSMTWNSLYTPTASGALSCNWLLNGDKMCGKVVANYDEFLQHLKSHTNLSSGHTCHWNSGDKFCGKVFPSAEELAQHLRIHSQEVAAQHSPKAASLSAPNEPLSPRSAYLNSLRYLPFRLPTAGTSNLGSVPLNVVPQPSYPLLNYGSQPMGYPAGLLGAPKFT